MMRSMFSGVSGLTSHQSRMDVIGDNIANVNTVGYKGSTVNFAEMMAQTEQAAQSPREDIGGTNPQQVGMGVEVGSIDTDITQGSLESTGVATDAAIEGDGYFVVEDAEGRELYTRNGSFDTDAQGNLVTSAQGLQVQGWSETTVEEGEPVVDRDTELGSIDINMGASMPEGIDLLSSEVTIDGNLNTLEAEDYIEDGFDGYDFTQGADYEYDIGNEPHHTITFDVFDAQGQRHTLAMDFIKTGQDDDGSDWEIGVRLENLEKYEDEDGEINFDATLTDDPWELENMFDSEGRLNLDELDGTEIEDGVFDDDTVNDFFGDIDGFKIDDDIGDEDFILDFSDLMQQADDFTVAGAAEDGYEPGVLDNFTIEGDGTVMGQYTNGLNAPIGQIALATFENPGGLTREGGSLFNESANSGEASIGVAGRGGRGEIRSGTLEMSNVDLAEEFTDMIRTQRGYQANSSSITTSDEMLQELVNLAR